MSLHHSPLPSRQGFIAGEGRRSQKSIKYYSAVIKTGTVNGDFYLILLTEVTRFNKK
jgi:hypothetical protein